MSQKNQIGFLLNKKFSYESFYFYSVTILVTVWVFYFSLVLTEAYYDGDQGIYRKVFNKISTMNIVDAKIYYAKFLSSNEIVHFIMSYISSKIMEKNLFIAIINSILAFSLMVLFRQWKANILISAALLTTNYYFWVIFIPAERLKFGILFLVFALIYSKDFKKFLIFSLISISGHFSLIILYSSIYLPYLFLKIKLLLLQFKLSYSLLFITITIILGYFLIGDVLIAKVIASQDPVDFYGNDKYLGNGLVGIRKPLLFCAASLFYAKNKTQIIYLFIPLIISAYILGDSRINMFCFFVFLYSALPVRKGLNIGIFLCLIYFGNKNYDFMVLIFKYGNGFHT